MSLRLHNVLFLHLQSHPGEEACPIVVFSSFDDEDHIAKARQLGASGYIVKPTSFDDNCRALFALFEAEPSMLTESGR